MRRIWPAVTAFCSATLKPVYAASSSICTAAGRCSLVIMIGLICMSLRCREPGVV